MVITEHSSATGRGYVQTQCGSSTRGRIETLDVTIVAMENQCWDIFQQGPFEPQEVIPVRHGMNGDATV